MINTRFRKERHPALPPGHQQPLQLQMTAQTLTHLPKFVLILPGTGHGLKFRLVGGEQGRAAIPLIIPALGVHQNRHTQVPSHGHEADHILQGTLGVVRKDHRPCRRKQGRAPVQEGAPMIGAGSGLKIHAQQLLLVADDPQLDGRRTAGTGDQRGLHLGGGEQCRQMPARLVIPHRCQQMGPGAQGHHIESHIGRTARPFFFPPHLHHRDRRFRRDALDAAEPVAIQHDIAHDEHLLSKQCRQGRHHIRGGRWHDSENRQPVTLGDHRDCGHRQ